MFLLTGLILILCALVTPGEGEATGEYPVKAALIFKLAKYVRWPASPPTFSIGILGDDPFGDVLDQLVKGESINKRTVTVKRSHNLADLKSCDVLYIARSEKEQLRAILRELGQAKVLTVGDTDGFCREGGMINLIVNNGRLSFEINSLAAKKRGIEIDPQVLSLAKIVDSDPG
jgi:hypothetical protein